ncbi:MAG: hypothetical protein C3F07_20990 [Anaerolineales bacterium]|nr:hypothetical protein [Anaerolineae bacterium]PWB68940.1 MAG: hypothetical protein C3F07_20990 [Anaerolineales bacterium]
MQTSELNIFIDCTRTIAYNHLAEPINMIGLLPLLSEIDVLKERKDEAGIPLRPFYTVETFKWFGLPIFRSKVYSVIRLTNPEEEMEYRLSRKPGIELVSTYSFRQYNDQRTHITQSMSLVRAPKFLANIAVNQARQAQRALLSNLKVRLEKK